jgi:amino acid transporter
LGVRQLAAVIFNYTVGSGIFVLPAVVAAQLGPSAVLAYLVCAVVMALTVLCFAEAGSRVSASGGPYAYVGAAIGPYAGFLAGVLNVVSALTAAAAVALVFASSAAALLGLTSTVVQPVLVVVVLTTVAWVNIKGLRGGARLVEFAVVAKLIPLVAFVVIGVVFVRPENLLWSSNPPVSSVMGAAGILIFAFSGIEGAIQPSGEVRTPSGTVPRAVFLAMAGVVVLYVAIQGVGQGLLGPALADDQVAPLASAAASVVGPAGRTFMLAGAAVSMFGFLCGSILSGPRSLYAFASHGLAPRQLARVHQSRHTPHVAIVSYVVIALALALSGSFERLLVLTNVSALLVYISVAVAAWRLRRRDVRMHGDPFVTPGGPLVPALTCAAIVGMLVATATWIEVVAVALTVALATAAFVFRRRWGSSQGPRPKAQGPKLKAQSSRPKPRAEPAERRRPFDLRLAPWAPISSPMRPSSASSGSVRSTTLSCGFARAANGRS